MIARERLDALRARLRRPSFSGLRVDVALALTLAVLGGVIGGIFVDERGQGSFYQHYFGPAVMQACGHGYTDYADPALLEFLNRETEKYECPDPYLEPLRSNAVLFALVHRYLLSSASALWAISGVSWDALLPLFVLLFALTSAGLYAVFRLVVGRTAATVGALVLMTSPGYLPMLRELRDFAKVPFMLGGFFLLGLFIKRRFSLRDAALVGAAAGAVLGIGFGFRGDVLGILPLLLVGVALFAAGGLRADLAERAAALGAFAVAFAIAAAPVLLDLRESEGGGNATLMAVHGITAPFNSALGVEQDLYSPGYLYNDSYAVSLVNAHAYRIEGYREKHIKLETAELEKYSQSLYFGLARNFPADWALRGRASVERVLELGQLSTTASPPVPPEVDALGVPSKLRDTLGDRLRKLGGPFLIPILALLVGALTSFRSALFALGATVYLSVLSTVQFSIRHIFQLELIWWLAAVFLLERLVRAAWWLWRERARVRELRPERPAVAAAVIRAGGLALVLIALSAGVLIPLRAYQEGHVKALLERYEQAPRKVLPTRSQETKDTTLVRFAPADDPVWEGPPGGVLSALFVATFSRDDCPFVAALPVARYEAVTPYLDWSTKLDVRLPPTGSPSSVDVYFVGFQTSDNRLLGIELPREQRGCLERVAAVDTDDLPLLLYATLPDDWREVTPYATLAKSESRRRVYERAPLVVTSGLAAPLFDDRTLGEAAYEWAQPAFQDPDVRFAGSGWSHDAKANGRFAYLVQTPHHPLDQGDFVIVHGFLEEGGVTIGLQRDNAWASVVNVTTPGEFYAAIEAPFPGPFSLVVANNLARDDSRNTIRIESARWNVPAVSDATPKGKTSS